MNYFDPRLYEAQLEQSKNNSHNYIKGLKSEEYALYAHWNIGSLIQILRFLTIISIEKYVQ